MTHTCACRTCGHRTMRMPGSLSCRQCMTRAASSWRSCGMLAGASTHLGCRRLTAGQPRHHNALTEPASCAMSHAGHSLHLALLGLHRDLLQGGAEGSAAGCRTQSSCPTSSCPSVLRPSQSHLSTWCVRQAPWAAILCWAPRNIPAAAAALLLCYLIHACCTCAQPCSCIHTLLLGALSAC